MIQKKEIKYTLAYDNSRIFFGCLSKVTKNFNDFISEVKAEMDSKNIPSYKVSIDTNYDGDIEVTYTRKETDEEFNQRMSKEKEKKLKELERARKLCEKLEKELLTTEENNEDVP